MAEGRGGVTAGSLRLFDNHDFRLPYYELALERDLSDLPECPLPPGYRFENYVSGDKAEWIAIEKSAREFLADADGEDAWHRYYEGREAELEKRMFFAVAPDGRKAATATAFYDIRTGDVSDTGMLHWVAVRREYQGRGLSKPIILRALERMKELGYRRAVIPTQTTTWLACGVYLDLGFRPIAKNAQRNRKGWEIIRGLTDHPALAGFAPADVRGYLKTGPDGMDLFADERDRELLEEDLAAFFILRRILEGSCELVMSDHRKLIVCYSGPPFPVWIWTRRGAGGEAAERAYRLAAERGLADGKHRFNMRREPAEAFITGAARDGIKLSVMTNIYAYDCPGPVRPHAAADGRPRRCAAGDAKALAGIMEMFSEEIGEDRERLGQYRVKAEESVKAGWLFLWENASGEAVSCCSLRPDGAAAAIGLVYTRRGSRRKHYAENLVYHVTALAREEGYMPMLYTDADNEASNACYKKIGYILRDTLCTVGQRGIP